MPARCSSQRLLHLLAATCAASMAQAQGITDLGTLGGDESAAAAISANGLIVAGRSSASAGADNHACIWVNGTIRDLGTLGGSGSSARGLSADGSVAVGWAQDGSGQFRAFRWTEAGGMVDLGTLGGSSSMAFAVSADGSVVVGQSQPLAGSSHAFCWSGGTMLDLGTLGGAGSAAYGVSADGSVAVGNSQLAGNVYTHAFRCSGGTMTDLGTLAGGTVSYANAVSADGSIMAGYSQISGGLYRAFRWEGGVMTSLGTLGGDSYAHGISSNGQVIVGQTGTNDSGIYNEAYYAFRWTAATGMQSVEQWLAASGVPIGPGLSTFEAKATNADGSVVVGTLQNSHAFLARAGSGLIDVQEFTGSLAGSAPVPAFAIQDASLVMHGAHGHPVSAALPAGRQDLWLTGDWGRGDYGELHGSLGTAEVGYARGLTEGATLKVALGRTGSSQDTAHGGEVRSRCTYLLPELVVAFPESRLHATFSASYTLGEIDIDRGYLNAGLEDHSMGSPDVRSTAARVRLDWQDAFGTGMAAFTPFLSLTRIRTRIDAYTEHGGGFPARWDARRESSTQSRLGLDARWRMSERTAWNGRAEYVHRFEKHGTRASGQILGLSEFSMPGLSYRRNWISGGLGLEHTFGALTGSLMLTASTEGGDPTYWASGTLRWRF